VRIGFGFGGLGPGLLVLGLLALALAPVAAHAMNGDRLDRSQLIPTFSENFSSLDIYDADKNPHGRWKTSYDFGWPADSSSRSLPGEYEVYSDKAYDHVDPFQMRRGGMVIAAEKNTAASDVKTGGKAYTSGLLTTSASFSQLYGYFEMDASLPAIPGAWPAFWLNAPIDPKITAVQHNGEIDVMEFLGNDPSKIYCSLHWPDGKGGYPFTTDPVPVQAVTSRHLYGVLWTHGEVVWYIDNIEVDRRRNPGLDKPMIMLVNLAIGGWNKNVPNPALPPMHMIIYHVRAWRFAR
jgi:beta-glucanase (GH16 family)